jgi:signal transduction histidine kinase/DNA-binding response OmpR family regulator
MWFGSRNGLTSFYPNRITDNRYVPPVVLTGFRLFNKPVHPGADSPLHRPIWATDSLTLTHAQSIFALEFAALSSTAADNNRYRYRLEGLEKEWNEVDSGQRVAMYTNLPSAKYVFRVQGSNNDRVWNEKGVALEITVLPPWWATWWLRSMVGLGLMALVFMAYRSRVKALHLGAARLEAQVAQRTGELLQRTNELRVAKDAAEAANRAKTTFLANMSHELRTPLNAILGFSNLLREGDVSEKQRNDLDIINRSGQHLLGLIDGVLDVAKIEAGRSVVENASCDVSGLVREIMEMMQVRANEKNLQLLVDDSHELHYRVRTDASMLRHILVNLIGNALKFTEEGSVILRMDGLPEDTRNRVLLRFQVEDTGAGIAAEDQERIFEPFVQVGRPGSQQGTGLGLTITRQFVELMGGTIRVESERGKGSRFCVVLPAELTQEPVAMTASSDGARIAGLEPGQPECRILIIEDEPANRMVLERLLHDAGFQVRTAGDGSLGVELFRSWRPHLIWMDLRMPLMDGITTARHIRALDGGREVRIAAVTASVFASQRSDVLAAGMDDFVCKPYRPGEIFDCIARQLGVRYRRSEAAPASPRAPAAAVSPQALAALPHALLAEFRNAVVLLDRERITRVIGRIWERDSELGSALARSAALLEYSAIFEAIKDCQSESAGAASLTGGNGATPLAGGDVSGPAHKAHGA